MAGDAIGLYFPASRVHLFEGSTGCNVFGRDPRMP
jgi:hypothetical protein